MAEPVYIVDFCGTYNHRYPIEFWALWHPDKQVVTFGGDWGVDDIPDMPALVEPSEDQIYDWAREHESDI